MRTIGRALLSLFATLLLGATPPAAPGPGPKHPGSAPRAAPSPAPRLVVVIVIDQFRGEYLSRFRDRLGPDGIERLLKGGAYFPSCAYPYALTETSPGHATIATGTTPDRHGIVSNEWYDRAAGRMVLSVEDPDAPILGGAVEQPGCSPRRLVGDTLADEMRLASGGRARVFGVAVKPRAAILSTGRGASGAFWYDEASGRMVTSRYYAATLPPWVAAWNGRRPADRYVGRDWVVGGQTVVPLGAPGGTPGPAYYDALRSTPYIHDLLFDFARELVERQDLGKDATPDFLSIGLSGHDHLGHQVGPYSPAVAEMTARTDAQIAAFLRYLDDRLGVGSYVVALSSDHGVSPTLPQARAAGVGPRDIDTGVVRRSIERAIAARTGVADPVRLHGETLHVWFDDADLGRRHLAGEEAARVAGEGARTVDGILGYVTQGGATDLDARTAESYRLSTYKERSPDLFLVPVPFALEAGVAPALHGTPWTYDVQVPLLFYGPPFRAGTWWEACTPADLAPTIAAALGIPPPAMATGRVLELALSASIPPVSLAQPRKAP